MTDLPVRLRHHSRAVIEAELRRLARRVPTLAPSQLSVVGEAMHDLAATLILDRVITAPSDVEPWLHRLFGPVEPRQESARSACADHDHGDSSRAASISRSRRGTSSSRPGNKPVA